MKIAICAFLGLAGIFISPRTDAAAIVYTWSGFCTGTIGVAQFTDAPFSLEVFANTNNVTTNQFPDGAGGFYAVHGVDDDSSRITIEGIGSALFTDPERVFCNSSTSVAGFSRDTGLGTDLLNVTHPAFSSYDLRSAFGPISGDSAREFFENEPTTRGGLRFSAMRDVTFTVVPEPSVAVLLMATVAAGAARQCRRRPWRLFETHGQRCKQCKAGTDVHHKDQQRHQYQCGGAPASAQTGVLAAQIRSAD